MFEMFEQKKQKKTTVRSLSCSHANSRCLLSFTFFEQNSAPWPSLDMRSVQTYSFQPSQISQDPQFSRSTQVFYKLCFHQKFKAYSNFRHIDFHSSPSKGLLQIHFQKLRFIFMFGRLYGDMFWRFGRGYGECLPENMGARLGGFGAYLGMFLDSCLEGSST